MSVEAAKGGECVEIIDFKKKDCRQVVSFMGWKIQVLNYHDIVDLQNFRYVERHFGTDEVFVLMKGNAYLIYGNSADEADNLVVTRMERGLVYNVKCNVWHFVIAEAESSVLIVENSDTTWDNSAKYYLELEMVNRIKGELGLINGCSK